jgi:tetratricopeptide (TPR) repeat protein
VARDLLLQAITGFRALGNRRLEAVAQANLGGMWTLLGDPQTGYAASCEGLRLARLSGETRTEAWAHNSAQYAAHRLGRLDAALDHARHAEALFRAHGDLSAAWINAGAAARNLQGLGRAPEAVQAAEGLLAEIDAAGAWEGAFEAAYLLHCALAPVAHGRAAGLLAQAHRALLAEADRLAEHVPRETFLEGNYVHRAICDAARAPGGGSPH